MFIGGRGHSLTVLQNGVAFIHILSLADNYLKNEFYKEGNDHEVHLMLSHHRPSWTPVSAFMKGIKGRETLKGYIECLIVFMIGIRRFKRFLIYVLRWLGVTPKVDLGLLHWNLRNLVIHLKGSKIIRLYRYNKYCMLFCYTFVSKSKQIGETFKEDKQYKAVPRRFIHHRCHPKKVSRKVVTHKHTLTRRYGRQQK